MVSAHKEKLAGWGNYPVIESLTLNPRSEEEAKSEVAVDSIVPRGLGRSYGDQAVNDGRYVAICTKLNHFLKFDQEEGILECE
ncbi:MAG: FAD-binding oxidoreductase, partial [Bacteroidetes bacterium]|nr:FAD-binding oxidoreductase [Bacteroidota bacterium]